MIRVKSISEDGIFYLVNGWRKHRAFWSLNEKSPFVLFKNIQSAKSSLTKLKKIMPEYDGDIITFEEI